MYPNLTIGARCCTKQMNGQISDFDSIIRFVAGRFSDLLHVGCMSDVKSIIPVSA